MARSFRPCSFSLLICNRTRESKPGMVRVPLSKSCRTSRALRDKICCVESCAGSSRGVAAAISRQGENRNKAVCEPNSGVKEIPRQYQRSPAESTETGSGRYFLSV